MAPITEWLVSYKIKCQAGVEWVHQFQGVLYIHYIHENSLKGEPRWEIISTSYSERYYWLDNLLPSYWRPFATNFTSE
jgi:hypothetical protein